MSENTHEQLQVNNNCSLLPGIDLQSILIASPILLFLKTASRFTVGSTNARGSSKNLKLWSAASTSCLLGIALVI